MADFSLKDQIANILGMRTETSPQSQRLSFAVLASKQPQKIHS